MPKLLKISQIVCDAGTQSRANINDDAVAEYAERMTEGDRFPPVDVFFDGNKYYLADGFHRILAASRNGFKDFECNVHNGTLSDALWYAIGANRQAGVRRSAVDKRNAIEIALTKFPEKTQRLIADHVGCTQQYVGKIQDELTASCKLTIPKSRIGKDGKSRPTQYEKKQVVGNVEPTAPVEDFPDPEAPTPPTNDDKWKNAFGGNVPKIQRELTDDESKLEAIAMGVRDNADLVMSQLRDLDENALEEIDTSLTEFRKVLRVVIHERLNIVAP